MTAPEQDYAIEQRAKGAAMEMRYLLSLMSYSKRPIDDWRARIGALLDKVNGKIK